MTSFDYLHIFTEIAMCAWLYGALLPAL